MNRLSYLSEHRTRDFIQLLFDDLNEDVGLISIFAGK